MGRVAQSRKPCLAIMNMPPLPYLKRIPGLSTETLEACYADPERLEGFRSGADDAGESRSAGISSAGSTEERSPGRACRRISKPRASKPKSRPRCFAISKRTSKQPGSIPATARSKFPVKLKVHDSIFVPLAKWPMLMAGNYRCIRRDDMIPIKDAVHGDVDKSREIYDWVSKLCTGLGADDEDLVPFDKYAKAAEGLGKPSSAARALFGGAANIERVDCLVRRIAVQKGLQSGTLDEIVTVVDERLNKKPRRPLGAHRARVCSRCGIRNSQTDLRPKAAYQSASL